MDAGSATRHSRRWMWVALAAVITVALAMHYIHRRNEEAALVRDWPNALMKDRAETTLAVSLARPVYLSHCASCHGNSGHGTPAIGAPSLADSRWLYGDGSIVDIERTILYGIRSGHPKAHQVTDMPAIGVTHQLTSSEIDDVVEYILRLSGNAHEANAAARGELLFNDKGNCFDCHGGNANGNPDYGSPGLRGPRWLYRGDRATLRKSIYSGRHGLCPAWVDTLSFTQIRALAVFLSMGLPT